MSDTTVIRRQLKIKSGVAKRIGKEHKTYQKEAEDQQRKLDKFTADPAAEDWDIKNATRMMEESNKMIVDSTERLTKAVEELNTLVVAAQQDPALAEDPELLQAQTVLKEIEGSPDTDAQTAAK